MEVETIDVLPCTPILDVKPFIAAYDRAAIGTNRHWQASKMAQAAQGMAETRTQPH